MADLLAEKVLAICTILGLAAVLAPLVVLAGLRAGVIEGLRQVLLADPHVREIVTAANRSFTSGQLERLAALPDVAFLMPRTRSLAASVLMEPADQPGTGTRLELIPSATGDTLLPEPPLTDDRVVLSVAAAARLHAIPGTILTARLARILNGQRETTRLSLTVQAIAPPRAFSREAAFVSLPFALMVEDFQNGDLLPAIDLHQLPKRQREVYAGFRIYALQLEQVPALDAALRREGIDVVSHSDDVAGLLRIDRNLGVLFSLVAGLGGSGFLVSLGAGLWANVARKYTAFALLRFLGLGSGALRLFPLLQAVALAALGSALALAAALAAAALINTQLADTLAIDRPLCIISPVLACWTAGVTVIGAAIVALAAGTRAAGVEAWMGVTST